MKMGSEQLMFLLVEFNYNRSECVCSCLASTPLFGHSAQHGLQEAGIALEEASCFEGRARGRVGEANCFECWCGGLGRQDRCPAEQQGLGIGAGGRNWLERLRRCTTLQQLLEVYG